MTKYNPKTRLRVGGNMSTQGADRAGCLLALSAVIVACGIFVWLITPLVQTIRWW